MHSTVYGDISPRTAAYTRRADLMDEEFTDDMWFPRAEIEYQEMQSIWEEYPFIDDVSWKTYQKAAVLNQDWMARWEVMLTCGNS